MHRNESPATGTNSLCSTTVLGRLQMLDAQPPDSRFYGPLAEDITDQSKRLDEPRPEVISKIGRCLSYPSAGELSVDAVQHPDVAGCLRHDQHKFVLGQERQGAIHCGIIKRGLSNLDT